MKFLINQFKVTFGYPVFFVEDIFNLENMELRDFLLPSARERKVLFLIDEGVSRQFPSLEKDIQNYFHKNLPEVLLTEEILLIPGGEEAKNHPDYLQKTIAAIEKNGLCRHSFLIAIGGGAILDLAGFAAAIAHRGIKHIRIPTTVLSQNDSGVGVKNGVNAFGKKNFIGAFAPPFAVFNDATFLTTLSDRDWLSGISEAVKVALIKDMRFFEFLEESTAQLKERDMAAMKYLVFKCAQLHMEHIGNGDAFESGSSRPLDFGHWAAHKLEQISGFKWRHGEAVAAGIALDSTISYLNKMLPEEEWNRIIHVLMALGFTICPSEFQKKNSKNFPIIIDGLNEFREHLGGTLTIMLLEGIGKGKEVHEIRNEQILIAMNILKQKQEDLEQSLSRRFNKNLS